MTVKELIEKLSELPQDLTVLVGSVDAFDDWYTTPTFVRLARADEDETVPNSGKYHEVGIHTNAQQVVIIDEM